MPRAINLFKLGLYLIIADAVIVGLIFAIWPDLDLKISASFYDTATRTFPLAEDTWVVLLRNLNRVVDILFGVAFALAIIRKIARPELPLMFSGRMMLFLSLTFALAPGVAANVIFKENWGRPRPVHVTQFNGPAQFVRWSDPGGSCQKNCSFFSGEVSAAAWTLAPAVLAPAPWRPVAFGAALVFTAVNGFVRVAQGGHFFSDAAFAVIATAFIIWLMYGAIYRGWWRDASEDIIEARMTRFAYFIRGLFGLK
jgi:membrane-associated PAP2 superfamily phosphatase